MFKTRLTGRTVVPALAILLLLPLAGSALAESGLYKIDAELFENDELTASPTMIVEQDKPGRVVVGDTAFEMMVADEGERDGRPVIRLTAEVKRLHNDGSSRSGERTLIAPVLILDDSSKPADQPATVSVADITLTARAQRVTPSEGARRRQGAGPRARPPPTKMPPARFGLAAFVLSRPLVCSWWFNSAPGLIPAGSCPHSHACCGRYKPGAGGRCGAAWPTAPASG